MELQEKLRCLRKESGTSQIDLAEKLEVSRQTISRWEAGTSIPTTENLMRLSTLYGVPLDEWVSEAWTVSGYPKSSAAAEAQAVPDTPPEEALEQKPKWVKRHVLFITLFLAAGLIIGGLLYFRQQSLPVKMNEMEGEVIDFSEIDWECVSFLPNG